MNRASLDRGFGRCIVLRKYGTSLKKYANRTQVRPALLHFAEWLPGHCVGAPHGVCVAAHCRLQGGQPATVCPSRPSSCQDRIVLPAAATAAGASAARPGKFRILDRDGIAAAGEVLTQGGWQWLEGSAMLQGGEQWVSQVVVKYGLRYACLTALSCYTALQTLWYHVPTPPPSPISQARCW